MRKSINAALFSALVFPGTGHFTLEYYRRGLIFFIPALLGGLFLILHATNMTYSIIDQINQGRIPLDISALLDLILTSPGQAKLLQLKIATYLFVIPWILSIPDSYLLGRKHDQEKNN